MALIKLNNRSSEDTAIHGRRNLIINGAMQVAQRGDVTGITAADVYGGADRFPTNGSSYGTVSLVQEADAPEGFAESQRVKFTTARSTTAAGDHFVTGTRLEGQDLQRFKKGTSNAESMTVSFYAKASQATTIQLELYDADNARHAGKEFAITTSWARYSYTFAGDTTGAFDNNNSVSMYVFFWLGAGTQYTSGTNPDGSWMANNDARRVHSNVGTTFMDTLNAEFNLTGVQLEVGEIATPFEHRSYGEELALCQRYFQVHDQIQMAAYVDAAYRRAESYFSFPVEMRATPTVNTLNVGGSSNIRSPATSYSGLQLGLSKNGCNLHMESLNSGYMYINQRKQSLDAEL
jgi:hypothetical protein